MYACVHLPVCVSPLVFSCFLVFLFSFRCLDIVLDRSQKVSPSFPAKFACLIHFANLAICIDELLAINRDKSEVPKTVSN